MRTVGATGTLLLWTSRTCHVGAFHPTTAFSNVGRNYGLHTALSSTTAATAPWFAPADETDGDAATEVPSLSSEQLKAQILQLGAALDRGQAYNPTSGEYYADSMRVAKAKILQLLAQSDDGACVPAEGDLTTVAGEWELVLTTVKHGIFRSSPFFLAVQEAFSYAVEPTAFGEDKATLFFKLHELQTCSFGVSKVGRVAQQISPTQGYLYSEFDTSLFALTVIPLLGFGKLLPTFGGTVITASTCEMAAGGELKMVVDYTTSRPVKGLSGLGEWIWSVRVPVGFLWKLLPWNQGREAACSVFVRYVDRDFRVVEDKDGDLFVYSRPVVPRSLDLMDN